VWLFPLIEMATKNIFQEGNLRNEVVDLIEVSIALTALSSIDPASPRRSPSKGDLWKIWFEQRSETI
jgi:hypothetical protein